MNKTKAAESCLVTPPSSAFLGAQAAEALPELNIGPGRIPLTSSRVSRASSDDKSHTSTSSFTPFSPPAMLVSSNRTTTAKSTVSKKSKPSRKTTHSQIEKRRREKINDTMQRLKDLVPACHVSDSTLRKLDVLTATADYVEELQRALRNQPASPDSVETLSLGSVSPYQPSQEIRRSGRPRNQTQYADSPTSISTDGVDDQDPDDAEDTKRSGDRDRLQVDEVSAAESLIQIAESPMLGPVVERNRMSISELMHL